MSGWGSGYKPPATPRRPCSAYAYYVQDNYRYQTRITGIRAAATIFQVLHAEWMAADESYKEEFVKRAKEDKQRYEAEMGEYFRMIKDGQLQPEPKKPRKTEQRGYPRVTRNAYVFFSNAVRNQIREENPGMPYVEVMKEIGQRWSAMSDEEKKVYRRMRDVDKDRYRVLRQQFTDAAKRQRRQESLRKDKERLLRLSTRVFNKPTPIEKPAEEIAS